MNKAIQNFLYPHARKQGPLHPEQLLFNANLQEFAQRVGYISNLHTGGKLSSEVAFEQIRYLWNEFQGSQSLLNQPNIPE